MGEGKFIALIIVLLFNFLGLISLVFNFSGKLLILEVLAIGVLLLWSLLTLFGVYFDESWGYSFGFIMLAFNILNLLFIQYLTHNKVILFGILYFFNIIGFYICVGSLGKDEEIDELVNLDAETQVDEAVKVEKKKPKKTTKKKSKKS